MRIVFWLSLIGIFYAYAGYPLVMWLLARLYPRPWIAAPITPSVSIVVAVHNGVSLLPRKIRNFLAGPVRDKLVSLLTDTNAYCARQWQRQAEGRG